MIKLFFLAVTVIYVGYRIFQNFITTTGTGNLMIDLESDPAVGETFAESLDMTIQRVPIINPDADKILIHYLPQSSTEQRIGSFTLKHVQRLQDGRYLFVTTVYYAESVSFGRRINTTEIHNLNFVFLKDETKNQYVVLSDIHTELVDKNLRSDFAQSLFKEIQP